MTRGRSNLRACQRALHLVAACLVLAVSGSGVALAEFAGLPGGQGAPAPESARSGADIAGAVAAGSERSDGPATAYARRQALPDARLASAGDVAIRTVAGAVAAPPPVRPKLRDDAVPQARWAHRPEAIRWTRAALAALKDHGAPLVSMVPGDIAAWCPAYVQAGPAQRRAFWVGFLSALTKHESTYRPEAVGGGGLWYGLLQILPSTARLYKCQARSGAALKDGSANLSCAIRIMARTVPRDGVIHAYSAANKRRWRGVSADWGPMRSAKKRADMAGWLKQQSYCRPLSTTRPRARPEGLVMVVADGTPG